METFFSGDAVIAEAQKCAAKLRSHTDQPVTWAVALKRSVFSPSVALEGCEDILRDKLTRGHRVLDVIAIGNGYYLCAKTKYEPVPIYWLVGPVWSRLLMQMPLPYLTCDRMLVPEARSRQLTKLVENAGELMEMRVRLPIFDGEIIPGEDLKAEAMAHGVTIRTWLEACGSRIGILYARAIRPGQPEQDAAA